MKWFLKCSLLQGVPQYCINFCFLNFSASYKQRNSIFDNFQQPISWRFWKYPILYYSVKLGPRYWQNTTGRSFQKLTFFVYYSMKQFSIHELSWVLMSSHKHSCALMSTHKYGAMAQWALMSADERPWLHGAMLMTAFELSWVLIAPWPQAHECSWTLMSAHWQSGTLMVAFGCLLVPMSVNGCSWGPVIAHEKQLGEAMNTRDLRAMEQWALMRAQKQSWAWCHGVMDTHLYSWALIVP